LTLRLTLNPRAGNKVLFNLNLSFATSIAVRYPAVQWSLFLISGVGRGILQRSRTPITLN